mmetsp:Transcript_53295/g.167563  ORF Transcript_53295/g.167563 Transcript_53295/m.167563 type:complete len:531 (+) Transcript_53295:66-1658(+)
MSWHPRLVSVGLKGSLCSTYPGKGVEEQDPQPELVGPLWEHGTASHRSEPVPSHPFQLHLEDLECEEDEQTCAEADAEAGAEAAAVGAGNAAAQCPAGPHATAAYNFSDTVRSWTDYIQVRLPASSIHELAGWHHGVAPFATFFDGRQLRGSPDEEPVLDLVRRQLEMCDRLDAVHAVLDMHNGFSGVADVVLRWVHEEQPKCGQLVMAVQPPAAGGEQPAGPTGPGQASMGAADAEACAWVSAAFSFAGLLGAATDVWVPAAVPLWSAGRRPAALAGLREASAYETSALVATALEAATLPYRLRGGCRPSEFLSSLTPAHRPACGLLLALPLPSLQAAPTDAGGSPGAPAGAGTLAELQPHFMDIASTPALHHTNPYASLVLRGGTPRRLVDLCAGLPGRALRSSFAHPAPLPLPVPFPQIFGPQVSREGRLALPSPLDAMMARVPGQDVEACPTATYLHGTAMAGRSAPLHRMASAVRAHQRSAWAAATCQRFGVETDELREVLEVVTDHLESGAAAMSDSDGDRPRA